MRREGFRIIVFALFISLLPAYSNALIEEKSSIVGVVTGASDKPLSGIKVRLLDSFFLVEVARAVTDVSGKFTLSGLLPGLYLVSVDVPSLSGMFKRVQVISGTPTFIDLRSVLKEDQLKGHNAWDKFKWTIRIAERNPLRNEEALVAQSAVSRFSAQTLSGALSAARNSDIRTEIAYMNVGSMPSGQLLSKQVTRVGVEGNLRGAGSWSFNGHVLGGNTFNYRASGDFEYRLSGHTVEASFSANDVVFARYPELDRDLITRVLQTAGGYQMADENKLWVTSVDLEDEWQMLRNVRIGYGTRIDYYGYLEERVSYSPRVQVAFQLSPAVNLHTSYYRNQSAPGNYSMQEDAFHTFMPIAFVPYNEQLDPQTAAGYQTGFDYTKDDLTISVSYFAEKVDNKIATVDVRQMPVSERFDAEVPFVIFNANDTESRGMQFAFSKRINNSINAVCSYNVNQSIPVFILEKKYIRDNQLFFKSGEEMEEYHDIRAGIEATVAATLTHVTADWKWSSGSPLVFGRDTNGSLSSVDVHVSQGVPVRLFSDAEFRVMVAVKNLLDQSPGLTGNADFERTLLYAMPRSFAGGVLVKF